SASKARASSWPALSRQFCATLTTLSSDWPNRARQPSRVANSPLVTRPLRAGLLHHGRSVGGLVVPPSPSPGLSVSGTLVGRNSTICAPMAFSARTASARPLMPHGWLEHSAVVTLGLEKN